jgi:hypothetical protein
MALVVADRVMRLGVDEIDQCWGRHRAPFRSLGGVERQACATSVAAHLHRGNSGCKLTIRESKAWCKRVLRRAGDGLRVARAPGMLATALPAEQRMSMIAERLDGAGILSRTIASPRAVAAAS